MNGDDHRHDHPIPGPGGLDLRRWDDQRPLWQYPQPQGEPPMTTLGNLFSTLTSLGLTPSTVTSVVQSLAANSPTTQIKALCTSILANSSNPAVLRDLITKLAEVPNTPVAVSNLLPSLEAATTPHDVVQAIRDIESALGSGFNLGF